MPEYQDEKLDQEKMYKDVWMMEGPSELGIAAVNYLKKHHDNHGTLNILDLACGSGRNSFYLYDNLDCRVHGIDMFQAPIDMANEKARSLGKENLRFQNLSFTALKDERYNVIFIANLYQFLDRNERMVVRKMIKDLLLPGGLLFLSTLSVNDTKYFGKGNNVKNEPNSFMVSGPPPNNIFIHFSFRDELVDDFFFLSVKKLYEHEEYDPAVKGPVNYTPWILIAENPVHR